MTSKNQEIFGISEAARLCGVQPKQLLYWEEQGFIPEPGRVNLGLVAHRQYGEKDLALIRSIKGFLDEGFTLPVAAEKAARKISEQKGGKDHDEIES